MFIIFISMVFKIKIWYNLQARKYCFCILNNYKRIGDDILKKYKKLFFTIPFLSLLPTIMVSCSNDNGDTQNPSNDGDINDDNEKPPIDDNQTNIDINNFNVKIDWIRGFRNEVSKYNTSSISYIFNIDEKILDNEEMKINYIGDYDLIPSYSIFFKKINKYYVCTLNTDYIKMYEKFSKLKIKNFLATKMEKDFKNNMIIVHEISDKDFFVPLDSSDESINFDKNELISFQTAWGVVKEQTKNSIFNINITKRKIREIIFGAKEQNFDNFYIENVNFSDLYILPKMIILDDPLNDFHFNINLIRNNKNEQIFELTKDEKNAIKLDIPNQNNIKSQFWTGTVCGQELKGYIAETKYASGISSIINTLIDSNNKNYANVLDRIISSNKENVKNFVNEIYNKGKRIKINIENISFDNIENLISLNINSSIKAWAGSSSLFGDGTTVGIYNINAIQKLGLTMTEYVKI